MPATSEVQITRDVRHPAGAAVAGSGAVGPGSRPWAGPVLMFGGALSNQLGAATGALAFGVIGPAGVVAVRQWIAAIVLLARAVRGGARSPGRSGGRCCSSRWPTAP
jgi:hypothetical protein